MTDLTLSADRGGELSETPFAMLIDGSAEVGSSSLPVVNPATGDVVAHCPRATAEDLGAAVAAAARAFPAWAATPIAERRRVLRAMADAIDAHADMLTRIVIAEGGKLTAAARAEVGGAAYFMRHFAELDLEVEVTDNDARRIEVHRAPLGVVAAITPWNFPILIGCNKIAAAMLAGNTVVLKPAPTTPLTALCLGMIVREIVPAGVLNVIADDNDLGEALCRHPAVRKISFTGSTATGVRVLQSAAPEIKRVTLELGGNDAGIVLDDCDPATVVPRLFDAAFMNSGQVCVAMKRLYVADGLYDAVCEGLGHLAVAAIVGPGDQQGTTIGPVQNRQQFEKLSALLEETRAIGSIVAGGEPLDGPGYFVPPTIVRDIPDDARLVREEQFGPILPVLRFRELDEVIDRVNDTSFGLGNSVWSGEPERAAAVAARLQSGTVWINDHGDMAPSTPFGGAKMSGLGIELGQEGLREFTQVRVVNRAKLAAVA